MPTASTEPDGSQPIAEAVRLQAAAWLVELQGDEASAATVKRWQAWRQAHPEHERAWQHIEAFRARLQGVPSPLAHAALVATTPSRRRQAIKTLAVALFAAGGAWTLADHEPWRPWTADARSGTGERLERTLPDGTRVTLNTGTAIDVRFTAGERTLHLVRGEILVETAHDLLASDAGSASPRPFVVQTRQGRIRALGTRFTVRDLAGGADGHSRIAVFEGAVEVRPAHAAAQPLVLQAGQQGQLTHDAVTDAGQASEDELAWTQGMIVAQDMPLTDFLAELARHRFGHLACDPAAADLKVTGTYPTADTDRVLDMLATTLPVEVAFVTRYWVTVRRR